MSTPLPPYENEIDLFKLFEILWAGKVKIIAATFVGALFGVALHFAQPSSYKVTTILNPASASVFFPYTPINKLLEKTEVDLRINKDSVFDMFVAEFSDYKEIIDVLSQDDYVKQKIEGLHATDKEIALIELAKSFSLSSPGKKGKNWHLSFEWHDALEGIRLFEEAIQQILTNIQMKIKNNLALVETTMEQRLLFQKEYLQTKLSVIKKNLTNHEKAHLIFLNEQSAIAKELNFEKYGPYQATDKGLYQISTETNMFVDESAIALNLNSKTSSPFYLRGYKAIEKEISLLKSRPEDERFMSPEYVVTLNKIEALKSDISVTQLKTATKELENDNPNDWVSFNLLLSDIKSQKKSVLHLVFSVFLGGIIGSMYVLISNASRNRKEMEET